MRGTARQLRIEIEVKSSASVRSTKCASLMKGKFVGGFVPFGYQLDKEKHRLILHPEKADEVRLILRVCCKSVAKVLTLLEKRDRLAGTPMQKGLF